MWRILFSKMSKITHIHRHFFYYRSIETLDNKHFSKCLANKHVYGMGFESFGNIPLGIFCMKPYLKIALTNFISFGDALSRRKKAAADSSSWTETGANPVLHRDHAVCAPCWFSVVWTIQWVLTSSVRSQAGIWMKAENRFSLLFRFPTISTTSYQC